MERVSFIAFKWVWGLKGSRRYLKITFRLSQIQIFLGEYVLRPHRMQWPLATVTIPQTASSL